MNLKIDFKNLFFTVLTGTIVAAVSYFIFSPSAEYRNKLTAEYRRVQVSYADRILAKKALGPLFASKKIVCESLKEKECNQKLIDLAKIIRNFKHFEHKHYSLIHELTIRNETDFSVSDLEIEHNFAYSGYVVFQQGDNIFHEIPKGNVFNIKELKPGKKVEATFFSKVGYGATTRNISITESGRILRLKPVIEAPGGDGLISEELSSIVGFALHNPFTAYIIAMFCFLSVGLVV